MKVIFGTLIFFFYFVKYPIAIFLPVAYMQLDYSHNFIMDILWLISVVLIVIDWFFPHEKPENCSRK